MNKLITIEGTDCSGKSTQVDLLIKRLKEQNKKVAYLKFPNYESPTGELIGEYILGRNGKGVFKEGASNVDPYVMSLYFTADRLYNAKKILALLEDYNVILDRYVGSNLAYRGASFKDDSERNAFYKFSTDLEFGMLGLPKPDINIMLYMPTDYSKILKAGRQEQEDEFERDEEYARHVEKVYLEVADLMGYKVINCVENNKIRTIENISDELVGFVLSEID